MRGQLLKWIRAFLTGRSQVVRVDEALSDHLPVTSGVPQGSCVGPICFLVFINSLPSFIRHSKVYLFADDSKFYLRFKKGSTSGQLQEDLNGVYGFVGLRFVKGEVMGTHLGGVL